MSGPVTPDQVVAVLNRALAADPEAVSAIFSARVPCNDALAEDRTIQVRCDPGGACSVGILGLLNGIFGVQGAGEPRPGWGYIFADCEVVCPEHGTVSTKPCSIGDSCPACGQKMEQGPIVKFGLVNEIGLLWSEDKP